MDYILLNGIAIVVSILIKNALRLIIIILSFKHPEISDSKIRSLTSMMSKSKVKKNLFI